MSLYAHLPAMHTRYLPQHYNYACLVRFHVFHYRKLKKMMTWRV